MRFGRVVLAAGASQRMGRIKALLEFGADTALARIAKLIPLNPEIPDLSLDTLVVLGCHAEGIAPEAERLGLSTCLNADWKAGQTSSIRSGLEALGEHYDGYFLHPVDLPLISQADYDGLLAVFRAAPNESKICVPLFKGRRGHPVLMTPDFRQEFLGLGPDQPGHIVVRRAAEKDKLLTFESQNPWVGQDLDHPEDYAKALEALGV